MKKFIIAIDEGTTNTRAALYDIGKQRILNIVSKPLEQFYPEPSYVEENAAEIYAATLSALVETLELVPDVKQVAGIGITNQRETVIMWNKRTGRPLYNAIVWQCRRTSEYAGELKKEHFDLIYDKTGLIPDAYFSATKIKWLFDNIPEASALAAEDNLCVGTVDSYLAFKLTGGKAFVTDSTNAARTMLYNIHTLQWDKELLDLFGIPENVLPKVISCTDYVGDFVHDRVKIPVCGIAGDQQAALFGQCCFSEGTGKITYGTGLFTLYNTGKTVPKANKKVLTTIAYRLGDEVTYALEGSVFNAGSAVQWLRDELDFFDDAKKTDKMARAVPDTNGVYIVPAFTGLGAPYWNSDVKGIITGITRGVNRNHITRAVLEAMAYSAKDLTGIMETVSGYKLKTVRTDGGAANNNFLMQFQADLLGVNVDRPVTGESTALGAIYLCGLGLGLFDFDELEGLRRTDKIFIPNGEAAHFKKLYDGWKNAVAQCLYGGSL